MDVENAQTMKKSAGGSAPNEMKKIDVAGDNGEKSNPLFKPHNPLL